MIDEPEIVQSEAQPMAFIRLTFPREQIQEVMGPGHKELMAAVADQGVEPAGPWFTHHLRMDPEVFVFEICVPIDEWISPVGRVKPGELPGGKLARTVYYGPYEGLDSAWAEFDKWIIDNGLTTGEGLWEVYLEGPESDPDPAQWRTQLNRPLV
jgi:effector-binding domain-containing protein